MLQSGKKKKKKSRGPIFGDYLKTTSCFLKKVNFLSLNISCFLVNKIWVYEITKPFCLYLHLHSFPTCLKVVIFKVKHKNNKSAMEIFPFRDEAKQFASRKRSFPQNIQSLVVVSFTQELFSFCLHLANKRAQQGGRPLIFTSRVYSLQV